MEYLSYLYSRMIDVKNPYEVRVVSFRKKRKFIAVDKPLEVVDKETGEVMNATPLLGNSSYRDTSPFVKIYDPSVFTKLSSGECSVFAYVLEVMEYNGVFILDMDSCTSYTGLYGNSIYRALRKLCELDVLMKDSRSKYWVNPNIACKGSRDNLNLVFDETTSNL